MFEPEGCPAQLKDFLWIPISAETKAPRVQFRGGVVKPWAARPGDGFGVITGPTPMTDQWCWGVDLDVGDGGAFVTGGQGWVDLDGYIDSHDECDWDDLETFTTRTGSGGMHLWFLLTAEQGWVRGGAGHIPELGPHVDARGGRLVNDAVAGTGYLKAPPSGGYSVVEDAPIVIAPDWLYDLVAWAPRAARPARATRRNASPPRSALAAALASGEGGDPMGRGRAYVDKAVAGMTAELDALWDKETGWHDGALSVTASLAGLLENDTLLDLGLVGEDWAWSVMERWSELMDDGQDFYGRHLEPAFLGKLGNADPAQLPESLEDALLSEPPPKDEGDGRGTETRSVPLNLPDEFWDARPALKHIRAAAHAQMASPDAVLGVVLARVASFLDPSVTADIGFGPASLNTLVCPVGGSGAGKSSAYGIGRRLTPAPYWLSENGYPDGVGLGSGEGLIELYMGTSVQSGEESGEESVYADNAENRRLGRAGELRPTAGEKVRVQVRRNASVFLDEGAALISQAGRSGSTIGATLRTAWSGETLGQANARAETTRHIRANHYSLGAVIGFQPSTIAPLLSDAEANAGTPQRLLLLAAADPSIPRRPASVRERPGEMDLSGLTTGGRLDLPLKDLTLTMPDSVTEEVAERQYLRRSGAEEVDSLDAHADLMRLKVAALLAILDGRKEGSVEDWELAGAVWAAHVAVRDSCVSYSRGVASRAAEALTEAHVAREGRVEEIRLSVHERAEEKRLATLVAWVVDKVRSGGGSTVGALNKLLDSRRRDLLGEAVDRAVEGGLISRDGNDLSMPG